MREVSSTLLSIRDNRIRSVSVADEQNSFMRGLVRGIILSLIMWTAGLYCLLALR